VRSPEGRVTEFRAPGLLLGLREAYANDTVTAACPPGSQIVFFTDGLSEATRDIDEGLRRIRAAIADADVARADRPATALVEHVLRGSPATDDIAVLVAAIGPSARVASDAAERGAEALIAGVR
jgi:serine phosphatase RsbU (regulator of sigma subunit)